MMKKILTILLLSAGILQINALDIIFRYDDYRFEDDAFQNQMIEVFAEEQVPLHIAVIPYRQDTTAILQDGFAVERTKQLQREGILQIALHGFCHKGETFQGEFLALNETEQRFRLEKGSALLDSVFGTHIHIFIPPWNRYNQTTLDILADLGYNIISSELTDNQLVTDERFQYYQEGCDHPSKLKPIIARNAMRDGLVVCMFHRYDFTETFTMEDMRTILQDIKADPNLHIVTMDELYERDQSFNEERINANLHHPLLTKLLLTRPIILSIPEAKRLRVWDMLLHLLLVIILAFIGALILKQGSKPYWLSQTIVLVIACLQTWFQFVMPKVGLLLIIVLIISVIGTFVIIKN